eukprot:m.15769 g.15769  ORF g.15769 m.15769 type:complete len:468 (-) comp3459_c0_seq1:1695-3098(-)
MRPTTALAFLLAVTALLPAHCAVRAEPPSLKTVECALCVLAFEELEGLGTESLSEAAIDKFITDELCPRVGSRLQTACKFLASNVPAIFALLDSNVKPAKACIDLHVCTVPPVSPGPDMAPVPIANISLDLPPTERWQAVAALPAYRSGLWLIHDTLAEILNASVLRDLFSFGEVLLLSFPDPYRSEIQGIATAVGLPGGLIALLNLFYEITEACTSTVAQTSDGTVMFARNQDLGYGMGFTNLLRNQTVHARFLRNDTLVHEAVTFTGYVGLPTGHLAGKLAVAVNSRSFNGTKIQYLKAVLKELTEHKAHLATWTVRAALDNEDDFSAALTRFQETPLVTPVYFTFAGTRRNEGAVVARAQRSTKYVERLGDPSNPWYVLQTNYDRDEPAPPMDNRRYYADKAIVEFCANGTSVTEDCLLQTLSYKPVLNLLTLYVAQSRPSMGTSLVAHRRVCLDIQSGDPCAL